MRKTAGYFFYCLILIVVIDLSFPFSLQAGKGSEARSGILANSAWVRVKVDDEGLYRIDAALLASIGISIPKQDIPTIKMFTNGGRDLSEDVADALNNNLNGQPLVVGTAADGGLGSIIFYGSPAKGFFYDGKNFRHYINHYSNSNYYLLTWGGAPGNRAAAQEPPTAPEAFSPTAYTERIFFEEELRNAFINSSGSGKQWFGNSIFPKTYKFDLHDLDRSGQGGPVGFNIAVAHNSDSDGKFIIRESGNSLMEIVLTGFSDTYTHAVRETRSSTLPASSISSGGSLSLEISYTNKGNQNLSAFLDWIELSYPRSLIAIDNETGFFTDPSKPGVTKYTVNGFSGTIYGFDVTDPARPEMIGNTSVTGGMFIFKTEAVQNKPKRFFLSSKMRTPALEKTQMAGLRDRQDNAEMIVITHNDLLESANAYRDYRLEHDKMKVAVIRTEDIYTEFGSGIADPTAVRDFIAYAFGHWDVKPKYVLLWGDGHYDYKDITKSGKPNYVPAYETTDEDSRFNALDSYASDDFFANISGDASIELPIGRLPVDSPESGFTILEKIKKYENQSSPDAWRTNITLMADDQVAGNGETESLDHTGGSESLSAIVPQDFQQKKIYMVEYKAENVTGGRRKPKATNDMVTAVNTGGTLILNWIGHGNPRVWAHEEVLERDKTIPRFTNIDKLFFTIAATCEFGRYDLPDNRCGAEELVMNEYGGAIGVFAATRVVQTGFNESLDRALVATLLKFDTIMGRYPTIGEAIQSVKQSFDGPNDLAYNLLGDPFVSLKIPGRQINIESINGLPANDSEPVLIKAMSTVTVTGSIRGRDGQKDDSFNGKAVINVFDSDMNYTMTDHEGYDHKLWKYGGALNRSSFPVRKGEFAASFVVPKTVSFSGGAGRLFAYACSDDKKFAKGHTKSFIIKGMETNPVEDNIGPEIKLFLDSRGFLPCEVVSHNPMLIVDISDKTGVNTTGWGIGRLIEAWIDDNPNSIDLTDKFTTSLDDSRSGCAQDILSGLAPGEHSIKVRAWDVFDNFSIAETCFRIAGDNEGIVLSQVNNYPNPFSDNTVVTFDHNLSGTYNATLHVYNVTGQAIRTVLTEQNTPHTGEIRFDCRDNAGNLLPVGAYYYRITVSGDKDTEYTGGRMTVVR